MNELQERLRELGAHLDLPADDAPAVDLDDLFARVDSGHAQTDRRALILRVAAIAVALVVGVTLIVPSSRRAVAGWFGFDGVEIERDPAIDPPVTPDPLDTTSGTVVEVDGAVILYSEFDGSLSPATLTKTLGDGTDAVAVSVGNAAGVWIDGDPHEVGYVGADGLVVFERFAGNTLLWQRGNRVARLEGFATVEAAIEYAITL